MYHLIYVIGAIGGNTKDLGGKPKDWWPDKRFWLQNKRLLTRQKICVARGKIVHLGHRRGRPKLTPGDE